MRAMLRADTIPYAQLLCPFGNIPPEKPLGSSPVVRGPKPAATGDMGQTRKCASRAIVVRRAPRPDMDMPAQAESPFPARLADLAARLSYPYFLHQNEGERRV